MNVTCTLTNSVVIHIRLVYSSNALVFSAVTSDARYRSQIVRQWLKLLYVQSDGG